MKVYVDQDRCVGSGQCALVAPGVFDQNDEDGTAVLLDHSPHDDLLPVVRDAAAGCPALAIAFER